MIHILGAVARSDLTLCHLLLGILFLLLLPFFFILLVVFVLISNDGGRHVHYGFASVAAVRTIEMSNTTRKHY